MIQYHIFVVVHCWYHKVKRLKGFHRRGALAVRRIHRGAGRQKPLHHGAAAVLRGAMQRRAASGQGTVVCSRYGWLKSKKSIEIAGNSWCFCFQVAKPIFPQATAPKAGSSRRICRARPPRRWLQGAPPPQSCGPSQPPNAEASSLRSWPKNAGRKTHFVREKCWRKKISSFKIKTNSTWNWKCATHFQGFHFRCSENIESKHSKLFHANPINHRRNNNAEAIMLYDGKKTNPAACPTLSRSSQQGHSASNMLRRQVTFTGRFEPSIKHTDSSQLTKHHKTKAKLSFRAQRTPHA